MGLYRVIQLLSFLGMADTGYLSWQHLTASGQCGGGDCQAVLTSSYATILGIPVAFLGLCLYTLLFVLATKKNSAPLTDSAQNIAQFSALGFLFSVYFTYIQFFTLQQLCPFCLLSAICLSLIFLTSLFLLNQTGSGKQLFSLPTVTKPGLIFILQYSLLPAFIFFAFSYLSGPQTKLYSSAESTQKASFASKTYSLAKIDKKVGLPIISAKKMLYDTRLRFMENELLEFESKKQKISKEVLVENQVKKTAPSVTDKEARTFFQERKEQFKDQSYTSLETPIKDYLLNQKKKPIIDQYVSTLKETYNFNFPFQDTAYIKVQKNKYASLIKGSKDAPIQIVEFSDLECPHCKSVHNDLKKLMKEFPDKIAITFRHFPLAMHSGSKTKAYVATCAHNQNKFWAFIDAIIQDQKTPLYPARQTAIARRIGLNTGLLNQCLGSGKARKIVDEDLRIGNELGLTGTPTIFVNGKLSKGAPTSADILSLLGEID